MAVVPLPPPTELAARLAALPPAATAANTREAAVALALRWSPDPEVLLMQRRTFAGDPWSGQISFPGGKREPTDPDLVHTAQREAHEELTIDLAAHAQPLGQLKPIQAMARGTKLDLWITPIVFHVTAPLAPQPTAEAEAAFWLPLGSAARGDLDHRFHYADEQRKLILPAWRFEERVIWGLTFRMLASFLRDFAASPSDP